MSNIDKDLIDDCSEKLENSIHLKNEGNQKFKDGNYEEAIEFYLRSLELCDDNDIKTKTILFSNLAASKDHLQEIDEAIDYCNKALELNESHVKALLRRAELYRKTDKLHESLEDYKKYLELNPDDKRIVSIVKELEVKVEERNEKLKAEMLSKLKDLGNAVLKPFGLSTDNFNLKKNPETGGYSVDFQQNK